MISRTHRVLPMLVRGYSLGGGGAVIICFPLHWHCETYLRRSYTSWYRDSAYSNSLDSSVFGNSLYMTPQYSHLHPSISSGIRSDTGTSSLSVCPCPSVPGCCPRFFACFPFEASGVGALFFAFSSFSLVEPYTFLRNQAIVFAVRRKILIPHLSKISVPSMMIDTRYAF